jgi:hypothetical protein
MRIDIGRWLFDVAARFEDRNVGCDVREVRASLRQALFVKRDRSEDFRAFRAKGCGCGYLGHERQNGRAASGFLMAFAP